MSSRHEVINYALQRAAEITGSENARNELRLITKGKFIYFIAGGQLLAALRCFPEDTKEFIPFDAGLICLN